MRLHATNALLLVFLFLSRCRSYPLCMDSRAPVALKEPLSFCGYYGSSCCDAKADLSLKQQFGAMKISDTACAAVVKSIICAKCDPYSSELFGAQEHTVPFLCNSSSQASSAQLKSSSDDFCTDVWETCKDVTIVNSPFEPLVQQSAGSSTSSGKLGDSWQSAGDFCSSFGGLSTDQSICFDGSSVVFNTTQASSPPKGMCLERIGKGSYLNMAAHPDGSSRAFFANQAGKIWLATIPDQGSGKTMEVDEANPFVDLTDEVAFDTEFGLMGVAFHPNFTSNGRFFVSYDCDKTKSANCAGRCSCNSDVNCDPSKLVPDNGSPPCQYQTVIAEYTANSSSSDPSNATSANSNEVRRIFTMGLPFTSHHGGQILFGPDDGYLYFMMGDGGGKGDPYNFAQNKKSLLGKIMRLDVDNVPSPAEISKLNLWGNYSIPKDNPYVDDSELQPEIWAWGLRNPWRCSFDSGRPSYFYCADDGEDRYEEVDLISKGGNYGWNVYEGPLPFNLPSSPAGNATNRSSDFIFPVMGYNHSVVNKNIGSASIIGGYVYRGTTDPCLYGRYLYADLYAMSLWAGTETPESSGNYTSVSLSVACSKTSPIPCDEVAGNSFPSLGFIYTYGEDNNRDILIMTSKGVYRIVRPSECGYTCPLEKPVIVNGTPAAPAPASGAAPELRDGLWRPRQLFLAMVLALMCLVL